MDFLHVEYQLFRKDLCALIGKLPGKVPGKAAAEERCALWLLPEARQLHGTYSVVLLNCRQLISTSMLKSLLVREESCA